MRSKIQQIKSKIPNHLIYIGIIAALFILLFLKLSFWQLSRSEEKFAIMSKINQINKNTKPELITSTDQINKSSEYSYVSINGYWDYAQTIYLSNKFYNHKPGYHVITPFIIANFDDNSNKLESFKIAKTAVLVNRGWIADIQVLPKFLSKLKEHNKLKEYKDNNKLIKIDGVVKNSNSKQYILGENLASYSNYHVIQKIDLHSLKSLYNYGIAEKYLNLIAPKNQGFIINWEWTNISPSKHLAYAVQWLLLAITTILLYSYLCYNTVITLSKK